MLVKERTNDFIDNGVYDELLGYARREVGNEQQIIKMDAGCAACAACTACLPLIVTSWILGAAASLAANAK